MIRFEEIPRILGNLMSGPLPAGWPTGTIRCVEQDSRTIEPPGIFVAVRGAQGDGRTFIPDAAARGAAAVIGSPPASGPLPFLPVEDPRKAVALLAARLEEDPSHDLDLVGVTGTNGKTTTTWLLRSIWAGCGTSAALSGTLGIGHPENLTTTGHTTPDAPNFQRALRALAAEGCRAVMAEISSHALDQDRTYATRFRAVVFTNLTRDHLDYHGTFESYRDAKRKLFHPSERGDPSPSVAVVNQDDPSWEHLLKGSPDRVVGFGTGATCAVRLQDLTATAQGTTLHLATPLGPRTVYSPLIGAYNGWNVLAAYATALALELPPQAVEAALRVGVRVPGRMERIDAGQPYLVLVDYAHSPDALERALAALRPITSGVLTVVFGCGGDRDRGKRPLMGKVAARSADRIFLTSDNPRSESPREILRMIEEGIRSCGREPALTTEDREEAIRASILSSGPGDAVLIAGKGHETYQVSAAGTRPFDDREVARRALSTAGWTG